MHIIRNGRKTCSFSRGNRLHSTGPVSGNYRLVPFFSHRQATFYVLNKWFENTLNEMRSAMPTNSSASPLREIEGRNEISLAM